MLELDFRKDPTVLSALVDALSDGVFTVDARGCFMAWSSGAERITTYSSGEVVRKPCSVLKGKSSEGFGSLINILDDATLSQAQVLSKQWSIVTKRGRELVLDVSIRILSNKSGEVMGAIGSFKDVSSLFTDSDKVAIPEKGAKITGAFDELVGKSKARAEVIRKIRLAAESDVIVLLTGESGTGKELAARAIHALSSRKDKLFLGVNCSAIPDMLLESELFGHTKGAFTGAVKDKTGIFQQAEGGTLFLDEIGDVSAMLQVKLLRVLQEKEIRRLGDEKVTKINTRLITATNKNLKDLLSTGGFREDFYYRIRVFEINMPPLRERKEDIPTFVDHFIKELCAAHKKQIKGVSEDVLDYFQEYPWPGNIRELRNTIEHAFVTVDADTITVDDIPFEIQFPQGQPPAHKDQDPSITIQDHTERQRILEALERSQGNQTETAKSLSISRITLWKKMKRFGIDARVYSKR